MKGLSIEEKAKAYDEAIEKARKLATDLPNGRNDRLYHVWDLESIFPELVESEDERIRKAIHIYLDWLDGHKDYQPKGDYTIKDMIAWLEKQGEAWSEEDDIMVHDIDYALRCQITYPISKLQSMSNWIDNLKSRVQPQPKQEWSEEDETVLNNLIYALANDRIGNNRDEYVEYLKSLKDRVQPQPMQQWKPSDEQIKAIKWIIDGDNPENWSITLKNLYQDLKKLKG